MAGSERVVARCARQRARAALERWLDRAGRRALPVLAATAAAWLVCRLLRLPEVVPLALGGLGLAAVAAYTTTTDRRWRVPLWQVVAWTDREAGARGALMRAHEVNAPVAVPEGALALVFPRALRRPHALAAGAVLALALGAPFVPALPRPAERSAAVASLQAAVHALPAEDPAAEAIVRAAEEALQKAIEDGRLTPEELRTLARVQAEAERLDAARAEEPARGAVARAAQALDQLARGSDPAAAGELTAALGALADQGLLDPARAGALKDLVPQAGSGSAERQAALDALRREIGELREVTEPRPATAPGGGIEPGSGASGQGPDGWPGEPGGPDEPGSGGVDRGGGPAPLSLSNRAPESLLAPESIPFSSEAAGRQVTVATVMSRRAGEAAGTDAAAAAAGYDAGTTSLYRDRLALPRHRDALRAYFGDADE